MKEKKLTYDVIVIGGGPSGMMTAGRAGERGLSVLLIEKNKSLGEKLKITGGGRCNITNAEPDLHKLLSHYGESEQFLYSIFNEFGVKETFSFFEKLGLPLVIQKNYRVFPQTEKALDVERAMEAYLRKNNVDVCLGEPATRIHVSEGKISDVETKNNTYTGKSVVVATGGFSHPETGSTGDGFNWMKSLGHTTFEPTPTIVPISVEDGWVQELAGKTLADIKISFYTNGVRDFSKSGNILCTHFGLSGPLILNSAKQISDMMHSGTVTATIDTYPHKNLGELEKHIISVFDTHKNKTLKNVFSEIAPVGTSKVLLSLLPNIDPEVKTHSVTKEMRKDIVGLLKALPITITGLMGFDRAVVADGGVPIDEVDMRTMRSKKIQNLFLTGDMLHIERPSGGYSLQLCWTTGYVAGSNV